MADEVELECKKCGMKFSAPTKKEAKKKLKEHAKEKHKK